MILPKSVDTIVPTNENFKVLAALTNTRGLGRGLISAQVWQFLQTDVTSSIV